jgi:transcriptional regulator GlxA family with amidase domain
MKTLVALAAESCMASCPVLFADMAAYADRALGGGALRALVATKGGAPVAAFGGSLIAAQAAIESVDGPSAAPEEGRTRADALCLPVPLGPIGRLYGDRSLAAEVRRIHSQGALVAAPCASVFLLAEAGMIEGRRVPIHPGLSALFAARYPGLESDPGAIFRDDPDLLCSVGAGSTPELGILLLRRLCGAEAAAAAARVFLDRDGAERLATLELEEATGRAAAYADAQYPKRLRLADLAAAAGLEERTFARRFSRRFGMSPMDYLRLARCRAAAELLGSTGLNLEEIAWKVGYADASSFSRAFKTVFGRGPAEIRATNRR